MNMIGFLILLFFTTTWMPIIYGLDDRATEIFFGITNTSNISQGLYNGTG